MNKELQAYPFIFCIFDISDILQLRTHNFLVKWVMRPVSLRVPRDKKVPRLRWKGIRRVETPSLQQFPSYDSRTRETTEVHYPPPPHLLIPPTSQQLTTLILTPVCQSQNFASYRIIKPLQQNHAKRVTFIYFICDVLHIYIYIYITYPSFKISYTFSILSQVDKVDKLNVLRKTS